MRRAAAIIVLIALAAANTARAADADRLYTEGSGFYHAGDYANAEKQFSAALAADPDHASSHFMMGETLSRDIRRLREAEGFYKKSLTSGKRGEVVRPQALFSLAVLYMKLGSYEDALGRFSELARERPDYYEMPAAYNHMGVASYHLDRYDEALGYFKSALRLKADMPEAVFNMKSLQTQLAVLNAGRYHQRMGDLDGAEREYLKAVEAYPNYVAAWFQLGVLYLERGDYDKAVARLTRAAALNPGYLGGRELNYRLAEAHRLRAGEGDIERAVKLYEGLGAYKDAPIRHGMALAALGRYAEAEAVLAPMGSEEVDAKLRAEAYYQLGLIHDKAGEHEKAAALFQKALSLAPGEERYKAPRAGR